MHTSVFHHGRKWARADNHMDCRHCPDCGATVNGNHGQREHQQWHLDLQEVLDKLFSRAEVEQEAPIPWTAAVDEDDGQDALEAG